MSQDTSSSKSELERRVLLSIGCNDYLNAKNLCSAEQDAHSMYHELTSGSCALYEPDISRLVLSASKTEIERAISEIVSKYKHPDTFVLYFAGHGILRDGSFYLCPTDVSPDAISVTAISISQVLRATCELKPRQAYVVIDACYSGGMALDLSTVLRSEAMMQAPGFGLSILASSAMSKESLELANGGVFTQQLCTILSGASEIHSSSPFLSLGDIGHHIFDRHQAEIGDQVPNYWALNLTGTDRFCRNPNYLDSSGVETTSFGEMQFKHSPAKFGPELARRLWGAFLDLPSYCTEELFKIFDDVVQEQLSNGLAVEACVGAISQSFADGVETHCDTFARCHVRAAMLRALLKHIDHAPDTRTAIMDLIDKLLMESHEALIELKAELESEKYCLLSDRSGVCDLYYLPIRLSEILGWVGFVIHSHKLGFTKCVELPKIEHLVNTLIEVYGNSIVAISDDQAPHILSFLTACELSGWDEFAEEVIGRLYHEFNQNFGRVLKNNPTSEEIIEFLLVKEADILEFEADYIESPTEIFSVILTCAALFDLDDAIDVSLIQLDHAAFSFYVPTSYTEFWRKHMDDGSSLVYQLGHGVWTLNDVRNEWRWQLLDRIRSAINSEDHALWCAAYVMSLLLPDRLPLFLVKEMAGKFKFSEPQPQSSGQF